MSGEAVKEASDGSVNEADDGSLVEYGDVTTTEDCCCAPTDCLTGYRQAYNCQTDEASGLWLAVADIQTGKILKVGGGDTGIDMVCYRFADCEPAVPDGDALLTDGIRGWFDSCSSCYCDQCYQGPRAQPLTHPNKLTLTVTQAAIDCCLAGANQRLYFNGSAAGTWEIPLSGPAVIGGTYHVGAYGEITVSGLRRREWRDDVSPFTPFTSDPDCNTGFSSIPTDCCGDGGVLTSDTVSMRIRVIVQGEDGGCVVTALVDGFEDCKPWEFAMPGCDPDADSGEEDLVWTANSSAVGNPDCSGNGQCPAFPAATGTGVLQWAP